MSGSLQLPFTQEQIDHIVALLTSAGVWDVDHSEIYDMAAPDSKFANAPRSDIFGEAYKYIDGIIKENPTSIDENTRFWFSQAGLINSRER
ncbi:hypothetical protein [Solimonas terrae]|uniref:Uncharacterized protein n=1 Tax=Solimonas terrae TaxID=1396819 RepID=A0A6M2BMG7_9GAMM|nr:hypothetical protein [Solimonas terrae]NGY03345.1 hypothetical protein [Solimonas terrae]